MDNEREVFTPGIAHDAVPSFAEPPHGGAGPTRPSLGRSRAHPGREAAEQPHADHVRQQFRRPGRRTGDGRGQPARPRWNRHDRNRQRGRPPGGHQGEQFSISYGGSTAAVYTEAIQTRAPINPGNSGGPRVDAAGHLVGLNAVPVGSSNALLADVRSADVDPTVNLTIIRGGRKQTVTLRLASAAPSGS